MKRVLNVKKKIGNLSKNSKNPFFKSAYLNLDDLLNAVEPLLQDEGLILSQPIIDNSVHTQIIDSETGLILMDSSLPLPDLKDPQKIGGCVTYFRRYTLKSLLAIAEDDDDGNLASKPAPKKKDKLPEDRFARAVIALQDGKIKVTDITKYDLTPLQVSALKLATL